MTVFGEYAGFYDMLYQDKDYLGEADFIDTLLKKCALGGSPVLDLGCGTGIHALNLVKLGYTVHGVDRSKEMLALAKDRIKQLTNKEMARLKLTEGDVRKIDLGNKYDVVLSLFHVASYLTGNRDLEAFFPLQGPTSRRVEFLFFIFGMDPQSRRKCLRHERNTLRMTTCR